MRHHNDITISQVKRDMDIMRNDIAKLSSALMREKQDDAKRFTEGILKSIVDEGHSLVDNAVNTRDQAYKAMTRTSKKAAEHVEEKIHKRPFTSLLLSFAFGLFVAELIEHR